MREKYMIWLLGMAVLIALVVWMATEDMQAPVPLKSDASLSDIEFLRLKQAAEARDPKIMLHPVVRAYRRGDSIAACGEARSADGPFRPYAYLNGAFHLAGDASTAEAQDAWRLCVSGGS